MTTSVSDLSVPELTYPNQATLEVLRSRRSIRQFTDGDVGPEEVDTLLELAMCAPNRLDKQPWHFVVMRDKAQKKEVADLLRVHPYLETAPVVVAVCGLPSVSPTWIMDVSAATENILIAATAMGLGAIWIGNPATALWDRFEETLRRLLAIPRSDIRIPALVALGHPAQHLPPHGRHDRFDRTKVHYGTWEVRG